MSNEKPKETTAYLQWKKYHEGFYARHKVGEVLNKCRKYYEGKQYADYADPDIPKPVMNICRDYVERVSAKITGTKRHVSFVADMEDKDLQKIDRYYEFQQNEMDDDDITYEICKNGFIDGVGVAVTSYDSDTIGVKGIYKGHLKRSVIPFERCFFANPYDSDVQAQRYVGYYVNMEVGAVRQMYEGDEKDEAYKNIVPEDYFENGGNGEIEDLDEKETRVYFRFFRVDGEVYFEACTRYVNLYKNPHALNPELNEKILEKDEEGEENENRDVADYKTDNAKYAMPTPEPERQSQAEYISEKGKFSRYPISLFRPYPLPNCILGQCTIEQLIANQNIINLTYIYIALIMQSHASPKYVAKKDALNGQVINNSPSQVIVDYSNVKSNGGGWGIQRMGAGDAVNSNLIQVGENLISATRAIYGFNNIEGDQFAGDTSGYAYQQIVKQMNIVLEEPQKKLWRYAKENARTDIMFFRHYIDSDSFYYERSDSEVADINNSKAMFDRLQNSGKLEQTLGIKPGDIKTKPARRFETEQIDSSFFDRDFTIDVEVEQGIEGSEVTEAQHYNQIWQYVAQGGVTADKIRMLVENDPSLSRKTRASVKASLDVLESGQMAQLEQTNAMLQEQIQTLSQQVKLLQSYGRYQNNVVEAQRKASADQTNVARRIVNAVQKNQGSNSSEGEDLDKNRSGQA